MISSLCSDDIAAAMREKSKKLMSDLPISFFSVIASPARGELSRH
jgi:hypothetical protein